MNGLPPPPPYTSQGAKLDQGQPGFHSVYPPGNVPAPIDPAARFQQLCDRYEIRAEFASKLRLLSDFEIVVIADDSGSMTSIQKTEDPYGPIQSRWDELKRSLFQIVDIALLFDQNGIDVYFLNRTAIDQQGRQRTLVLSNVTERKTIEDAFSMPPSGFTPLSRTLKMVLDEKQAVTKEKKLLLLICTDGEPTDESGRVDIAGFRHVLAHRQPIDKIFVNIMACSDDPGTMAYLAKLDQEIKNLDVIDDYLSEKREITSRNPGSTYSYGDHIVKTLVGSIDPSLDRLDERSSCCALQ